MHCCNTIQNTDLFKKNRYNPWSYFPFGRDEVSQPIKCFLCISFKTSDFLLGVY